MVCLVVQVENSLHMNSVKKYIQFRFPFVKYITDFKKRRIILYKFDKNITNNVMNNIMKHHNVIAVMIDDFNFLEDPYF